MTMDDFERRLQSLPLREPTDSLDARVLSPEAAGVEVRPGIPWVRRPVPLWLAAAACVLMILAGLAAGRMWSGSPVISTEAPQPVVQLQVIYTGPERNPFDYTQTTQDFLPGPVEVDVHVEGGV
jgi:hypothetical protein